MSRFNSFFNTGNSVSQNMFGVNALYDINTLSDGSIRSGYVNAITDTDAQSIRFPGGMVEIDFNVMRMDNGNLRNEVINFLDDVQERNRLGSELNVVFVLPTQSYINSSEYTEFVYTVSTQYGEIVSGFEIGNEYSLGAKNPNGLFTGHPEDALVRPTQFGISETIYGQQVERIVRAVDQGVQSARENGLQTGLEYDPDIVMQMSDIVGASSSFRGTNDHEAADRAILSQISTKVMGIIDGFVGHYYYNEPHLDTEQFDGMWREVRSFPERIDSWNSVVSDLFGSHQTDKDLLFSEWNTNIRTVEQLGLKGASVHAKQFEYMIEMGADSAFVWPLQHNTGSSLAGHYTDTVVELSPSGQVFTTLNNLLNPKLNDGYVFSLSETSFSGLNPSLDVAGYTSDYESVFVLSNRSKASVFEQIDFDDGFTNISGGTQWKIGIDQSTSDGLAMGGDEYGKGRLARRVIDHGEFLELSELPFFDPENANHIKLVGDTYKTYLVDPAHMIPKSARATDVEDYWVVAEPDIVGLVTTQFNILSGENSTVTLGLSPFEVAVVSIEHSKTFEGGSVSERIDGGAGRDSILGRSGNDTLFGHEGDDTLKGGFGDDYLNGGDGENLLVGSSGDDRFDISFGRATVDGGSGIDTVIYSNAAPSILVDLMFEQINARAAEGDQFTDVENLVGTSGADNIRGTLAANLLVGGANVDYIFGRRGDDTISGGVGDDVLFGGVGSDRLIGGAHRDRAQYSESLTGVTVDLANPSVNTGEAQGDTFSSIEDLAGSKYEDELFGNDQDNRLFGREGADTLSGKDGNDYLNGGSGDDMLIGGFGDDVLRGGQGTDTFVFKQGDDVIEDFKVEEDLLEIDLLLPLSQDQVGFQELDFGTLLEFEGQGSVLLLNVVWSSISDAFDLV